MRYLPYTFKYFFNDLQFIFHMSKPFPFPLQFNKHGKDHHTSHALIVDRKRQIALPDTVSCAIATDGDTCLAYR